MAPVGILGQFQAQVGEGLVRGALLAAAYALYRTLDLAVEQVGNVTLHAFQVVDPRLLGRRQVLQAAVLLKLNKCYCRVCNTFSKKTHLNGHRLDVRVEPVHQNGEKLVRILLLDSPKLALVLTNDVLRIRMQTD